MTSTREAVTWEGLYADAAARVPDREARWIVEEASGQPFGQASGPAPDRASMRFRDMVERRQAGEPLQYVLGSWPFRRLDLMVDRRVLIPRPETEQVVEVALAELDRAVPSGQRATVVDLGTGSGAIALAVAQERPRVDVWAVDQSADAVAVARANLAGLAGFAAPRVRILEGDWWDGLPADLAGTVDLVVSNPPYVSDAELAELDPEVRDWEPTDALAAGPRGTEAIAAILRHAPTWLTPAGVAVIEIAPHQATEAQELARSAGFAQAEVRDDLAGRARILVARR